MLRRVLELVVAAALALPMILVPQMAFSQNGQSNGAADVLGLGGITPEGRWEAFNHESRYDVTLCGDDGTQLCAKLVWIQPKKLNNRNKRYLDQYVVDHANRSQPVEWKGDINIYGTFYAGTLRIQSYDKMTITGCLYLILCESYDLFRVRNPDGSRYTMPASNG